jgi:integrase/recombinase XerD
MIDNASLPVLAVRGAVSTITRLAVIPEEENLAAEAKERAHASRLPARREALHDDLRISSADELRQADHKAVIAWERHMREIEHAASSTIRRCLAALSSLFRHLIDYGGATRNPAREVAHPAINRKEGEDTIVGLRYRAILSVGLQVGLRRAEIAALKVGDLHQPRL